MSGFLEVRPTRYPPEFCSPDGLLVFDRVLRHYWDLYAADHEDRVDEFDGPWLRYLDACGADPPSYSSARIYRELFDGLAVDDRITDWTARLQIGGTEAALAGDRFRVSCYGRRSINGANLVTLHREYIDLPDIGSVGLDESWRYWRYVNIDESEIDVNPVRCLVIKVEAMLADPSYTAQNEDYVPNWTDQSTTADPPMWGVRLLRSSIYASPLRRDVTPERVVEDIVSPYWSGERFFCPDVSGVTCDQLCFEHLPMTRLDALLQIDEMLDWDMEATETDFTYRKPPTLGQTRDEDLYVVSLADPHYAGRITPDMDSCINGARINYTNVNERPKELVRHWTSETLGTEPKTGYFDMPESIRSKKQAERMMDRVQSSYAEPPIAGSASFKGTVPVASGEERDCLLMQPGELLQVQDAPRTFRRTEREISSVTLHPLTREAEVEMGAKSRKFEKVLARMAAHRPLS